MKASIQKEILMLLLVIGLAGLATLIYVDREFQRLTAMTAHVNSAGRLRMLSQRVELLTHAAARGEANAKSELSALGKEFERELDSLGQEGARSSSEAEIQSLARVTESWRALKQLSQALIQKRPFEPLNDEGAFRLRQLASETLNLAEVNVATMLPRAERMRAQIGWLLPVSVGLAFALAASVLLYIRRRILGPLRNLLRMLGEIGGGQLESRIPFERDDEIGRLIRGANATAEALQRSREAEAKTLAQLRDSEIRHRTLWELAHEAIVTIDADSTIRFVNPAVKTVFGYDPDTLIGQNISVLQPPHLREAHRQGMARYLASNAARLDWSCVEVSVLHCEGHEVAVELSFTEMHLSGQRWFVGTFRDVTERKHHEAELKHAANIDSLTGLANRNLLFDRIDQAVIAAKRHARSFGVLYLDLDNFKVVNDSFGHDSGDELLCEAGRRLLGCVREGDTVARVGGDEFVLLLADLQGVEDISIVAGRALVSMAKPFQLKSGEAFVGASIGASMYPEDGAGRAELIQHADIAMYRAKENGRNNFQRFSDYMQARYHQRMSMEAQLRKAIDNGELVLHYQPQIALGSGAVIGAEALVRWESPALGRVSPAQFIPLAEETGIIVPIGKWIIEQACQDAAEWQKATGGRGCRVAINLSARQFVDDGLLAHIAGAIARQGLAPGAVELEITESLVMKSPEQAATVLGELRGLGCQVALDDFGTGYSSLAYLRHFPLDVLKIDKSLISDVGILVAVIQLARSFGLSTIAEGVEDEAVIVLLRQLGCDIVQGYFYSRPLPLQEFNAFLARHVERPLDPMAV